MNKLFYLVFSLISLNLFCLSYDEVLKNFKEESNINKSIDILVSYADKTTDNNVKGDIYKKLASLYNLIGNIEKAQSYYEKASYTITDFNQLFLSSSLLIEMNELKRAQNQIDLILIRTDSDELKAKCFYNLAYIEYLNQNYKGCANYIKKIFLLDKATLSKTIPNYLNWFSYILSKNKKEFAFLETSLKNNNFSLNNAKKSDFLYSFATLFNEKEEVVSADVEEVKREKVIIAGSYMKEQNAKDVSEKIKEIGLQSKYKKIIISGKVYYRLYVLPIENDFDNTILLLKNIELEPFIAFE